VPATAGDLSGETGSWTVGAESEVTFEGEPIPDYADVFYFPVTDSTVNPRRQIVDGMLCNNCHAELTFHGGHRTNPNYCVTCHIPSNANDGRFPAVEGATSCIATVDFRVMIHKIHAGENLTQEYVLAGFGGTLHDFSETRYPADLDNCAMCHVGETYQLPLGEELEPSRLEIRTCTEDPSADTNTTCDSANWIIDEVILLQPERAVCTSCHDSAATDAHAQIMTTAMGVESCATCHGPGSGLDVEAVHEISPIP